MSAITRLREQGFDIRLTQKQSIAIKPADKLPDEWRKWIATNRQQVICELHAEAANDGKHKRLAERWRWFLSLATEHGIHPDVVAAEFPSLQEQLDVVEPQKHTDDHLRAWIDIVCACVRVRQRQANYVYGRWVPIRPEQ